MRNSSRHGFWWIGDGNTAPGPTFAVIPSSNNVNEGDNLDVTINTTGIPDGRVLYYTLDTIGGNIDLYDFVDGYLSGNVTISNNTSTFSKIIARDLVTEGVEGFQVRLHLGSPTGSIIGSSNTVTINDTSITPTYVVNSASYILYEGDTFTVDIFTTGLPANTQLFWSIQGNNVNANDFVDGVVTNNVVINANGEAHFTTTLVNDAIIEGTENFVVDLSTDFNNTGIKTLVASSNTFTIKERAVYNITPNTTNTNEGSNVSFNISTLNVDNGTTLYWTIEGSVDANDFTNFATTGNVVISNNAGQIIISIANDYATEGTESFVIKLRTDSIAGNVVATSNTVTINDTSLLDRGAPPPYGRGNKVMIVYDPNAVHSGMYQFDVDPYLIAVSIRDKEVSMGNEVTIVTDYSSLASRTDLDTFAHIWDVAYDTLITSTVANMYSSYLYNGGAMFLLGENGIFVQRDTTIENIIDSLGGNCAVDNWDPNASVTATIAPEFRLHSPISTVTFNRPGRYTSIGTGTPIATSGYGTHAAIWKTGSLSGAPAGAIVSVLDINWLVGGDTDPNFIGDISVSLNVK